MERIEHRDRVLELVIESRFEGVRTLGVDEHVWRHVSVAERGPKELTGMVDLTFDKAGQVRGLTAGPGHVHVECNAASTLRADYSDQAILWLA